VSGQPCPPRIPQAVRDEAAKLVAAYQEANGAKLPRLSDDRRRKLLANATTGATLHLAVRNLAEAEEKQLRADEWDEWAVGVLFEFITQAILEMIPEAGVQTAQRTISRGDVVEKVHNAIRRQEGEAVCQWRELPPGELANLPVRIAQYAQDTARRCIDRSDGDGRRVEPFPDEQDRCAQSAVASGGVWGQIATGLHAAELRRFVELVVGPQDADFISDYVTAAGHDHTNAETVRFSQLTHKVFAAWLLWRVPHLLHRSPPSADDERDRLDSLVRTAHSVLGGGQATAAFKEAKRKFMNLLEQAVSD